MKNFDLEAAKRGAAVCTRSGFPARIICWDVKRITNSGVNRIAFLSDFDGNESPATCLPDGTISVGCMLSSLDLMMRDDDYMEKLERGEYGNHVEDKREMADPAVKENLTTDRKYWLRVYAGQIMPVVLHAVITTGAKVKDEYKDMPADVAIARSTITLADALIEELEKK